jgi:hypothetical protein
MIQVNFKGYAFDDESTSEHSHTSSNWANHPTLHLLSMRNEHRFDVLPHFADRMLSF